MKNNIYVYQFSGWKKQYVLLCFPQYRIVYVNSFEDIPKDSLLVLWGFRHRARVPNYITRIIYIEDGFLRSVGLGSDLIRPMSWIVDHSGIYFNSRQPSDLEKLLTTTKFDSILLERARRFRLKIVAAGLSKYNVGLQNWQRPAGYSRVILVPGQVESDASLAFGSPELAQNIELLKKVRKDNPDAWLIFKPHPDVLAGMRASGQHEADARYFCDEVLGDISISHLLQLVDEVHVLTSLAGFEALLREKKVICYGLPFYAGWGLTIDMLTTSRRSRTLSLDELVAGCLLLYPTYFDRDASKCISAEDALDQLLLWRQSRNFFTTLFLPIKRLILRWIVGVR